MPFISASKNFVTKDRPILCYQIFGCINKRQYWILCIQNSFWQKKPLVDHTAPPMVKISAMESPPAFPAEKGKARQQGGLPAAELKIRTVDRSIDGGPLYPEKAKGQ